MDTGVSGGKDPGFLKITSKPSEVMVYVNGIYEGYTGNDTLKISVSANYSHTLRLEKNHYYVFCDTVSVSSGQTIVRHYELIPDDTTSLIMKKAPLND